jgi:hypothetical protein
MIVVIERGLGLTTQQILAAPEKAVYVALDSRNALYVRDLARSLDRHDLKIVVPGWLARCGRELSDPVVIDHAVTIEAVALRDRPDWHRALDVLESMGLLRASLDTSASE